MQELHFYQEIPVMHMLAGDTSKTITIEVEGDLNEFAEMRLLVSKQNAPDAALLTKKCERSGNTFSVVITSSESSILHGAYYLDFVLTAGIDTDFRRIRGLLEVHTSPKGTW